MSDKLEQFRQATDSVIERINALTDAGCSSENHLSIEALLAELSAVYEKLKLDHDQDITPLHELLRASAAARAVHQAWGCVPSESEVRNNLIGVIIHVIMQHNVTISSADAGLVENRLTQAMEGKEAYLRWWNCGIGTHFITKGVIVLNVFGIAVIIAYRKDFPDTLRFSEGVEHVEYMLINLAIRALQHDEMYMITRLGTAVSTPDNFDEVIAKLESVLGTSGIVQ